MNNLVKTQSNDSSISKADTFISSAAEFKTIKAEETFNKLPNIAKTKMAEIHRPVSVNSKPTTASYNYYSAPNVCLGEDNVLRLGTWKKQADDKTISQHLQLSVLSAENASSIARKIFQ